MPYIETSRSLGIIAVPFATMSTEIFGRKFALAIVHDNSVLFIRGGCGYGNAVFGMLASRVATQKDCLVANWLRLSSVFVYVDLVLVAGTLIPFDSITRLPKQSLLYLVK